MKIGHIVVCHTVSPQRLFASVPERSDISWYIFLHGQNEQLNAEVEHISHSRNARFYPYKTNRGLSRSWNEGIQAALADGCDAVWLLNDDLYFVESGYDPCVKEAEETLKANPNAMMVSILGIQPERGDEPEKVEGQGFSCGIIPKSTFEIVGAFDENFYPAYYEDSDYFRRCVRSGLSGHTTENVYVVHERSKTVKNFDDEQRHGLHLAMMGSGAYERRKWGDEAAGCGLSEPFGQPFGLKIPFERSSAPYGPGFDREDKNPV